jgi:hypothetical protein
MVGVCTDRGANQMPRLWARTPDGYLAQLPDDRRQATGAVRPVNRRNLPAGFEEGVDFGMLSYHVPLACFPDMYNGTCWGSPRATRGDAD